MGDQAEAPAASSMTMEAAEQLIQLSGGRDDGVSGESESKSADSVKAGEKQKGDDKEGVTAVVESSSSAGKKGDAEKGGSEDDEAVMGGVKRRRPRFRSLADIYRTTKRIDLVLVPSRDEAEDGSSEGKEKKGKGKMKKKRAAGGAAHDGAVAAAAPSKARRVVGRRSSTVRQS
jgi:hypothetical protein